MIKAYHADDEFGGIKVEFEGSADELLREFAHIGEGIYTAVQHAMNYEAEANGEYEEYDLEPGDHFFYNGIEFVLLDTTEQGDYFAIVADELPERPFNEQGDDGSNNWAISDLRKYLNGEYLDDNFNPKHLVLSTADLTADNGDDAYGTCDDLVIILSCEQYRKYKKVLPRYGNYIWTCTPWSCHVGLAYSVRGVDPSGNVGSYGAYGSYGVAPACTFNHSILHARRQAHDGRVYLTESEG